MFLISGIKMSDNNDISSKCVGYYTTKEMAEIAVEENICDIYENTYSYAIIEDFGPGTHPECRGRQFFSFNKFSRKYRPVDEPDECKNIDRFAIF